MRRATLPVDPRIFGLRLSVLLGLYRQRWRSHPVGELLAGSGIAVGVALVFGVLVANTSIVGSAREILHEVDGSASIELVARSQQGFSQSLGQRAAGLPGIKASALLLRQNAIIKGPDGERAVQLVGVTAGLLELGGTATQDLGSGSSLLSGGLGLPSSVAQSIGAMTASSVHLLANGHAHIANVRAILDEGTIGALAASGITVALLPYAQTLTGQTGRVTSVLIRAEQGKSSQILRELHTLAGNRLSVVPANNELQLVETAAKPTTQSTSLFVAISVMVGLLLALNAMLLTVPERRRIIAEMRAEGYDSRQALIILTFEAGLLGVGGSLAGITLGYLLARTVFHEVPNYLAIAFPASGHQSIHLTAVAIALGCGIFASVLASMSPIIDLRSKDAVDAVLHKSGEPGQNITARIARRAAIGGGLMIALVSVMVLAAPDLTAGGGVVLALATLAFIPLAFRGVARLMRYIGRKYHGGMLAVAVMELESTAVRSAALAGIAALAIYGSIAVGGARNDLIHGLGQATNQDYNTAQIWVLDNDENIFSTDSFQGGNISASIAKARGVASVGVYQGGYLNDGDRRLWIRARPPNNPEMLLSSQLLEGSITRATALLREGGWAAISNGFASEHHLHLGSVFTLPTPAGSAPFRVAAITTDIGWPPGAITLNTTDYQRWWRTTDPTAFAITLKPGVALAAGRRAVKDALGPESGLQVLTTPERIASIEREARQGLKGLSNIAVLLLVTAALALAAALWTAIYQRRDRLAASRAEGFDRRQLWRELLIECTVIMGIGCADGAALGLYGHALADRYLRLGTGFPAPFSLGVTQALLALTVVMGIALTIIALPGYRFAGAPAATTFQE
jgi:putative ABC transport system permease protein